MFSYHFCDVYILFVHYIDFLSSLSEIQEIFTNLSISEEFHLSAFQENVIGRYEVISEETLGKATEYKRRRGRNIRRQDASPLCGTVAHAAFHPLCPRGTLLPANR